MPPGATVATFAVLVITRSAIGAASSGARSVLFVVTGSGVSEATVTVAVRSASDRSAAAITVITRSTRAPFVSVPIAHETDCPVIVQPAGALEGVRPLGMLIAMVLFVAVDGPLLTTENVRSVLAPAATVAPLVAVASRSAAGRTVTVAVALLSLGSGSSVFEKTLARFTAVRSATATEASVVPAIVTLRDAAFAVAPVQRQVIVEPERLQLPPDEGVLVIVAAVSIAAGSRSMICTLEADAGPLFVAVTV